MITPDDFRRLAGHFATGVTVITALDADGNPCGMTANSFASVSLEPPLISIAVDHAAQIYPAMLAGSRFTVNILADTQEALSRRFAEGLSDRYDGVEWQRDGDDVLLDGALAFLCCEKWQEIPAGDHTIFVARVVRGTANGAGQPLMHFRGMYR